MRIKRLLIVIAASIAVVVCTSNIPIRAQEEPKREPSTKAECIEWGGKVSDAPSGTGYGGQWRCRDYTAPNIKRSADQPTPEGSYIDKTLNEKECKEKGMPVYEIRSASLGTTNQKYIHCQIGGETWNQRLAKNLEAKRKEEEDKKERPRCVVAGFGWIACPVLGFLGKLSDTLFKTLQPLLQFETLTRSDTYGQIEKVWSVFRNIANVGFVVIFLTIALSHTTGRGLKSYTVQKMLPRLVIISIAANISLPLAALSIDASNLAGAGMRDLIETRAVRVEDNSTFEEVTSGILAGTLTSAIGGGTAIGIGGLSLSGAFYGLLAILLPTIIASAIALGITLIILVARQAFLVILVVLMPVALMFQLMRGTSQYWGKWSKYFVGMLLVYPVVSVVFGASSLASHVIMLSGKDSALMSLMAIGVQSIPLLILPFMLSSLSRLSGMAGIASKSSRYLNSKVGSRAMGFVNRQRNLAAANKTQQISSKVNNPDAKTKGIKRLSRGISNSIAGGSIYRQNQLEAKQKTVNKMLNVVSARYHLDNLINNPNYMKALYGRGADRNTQDVIKAQAISQMSNLDAQLVKSHQLLLSAKTSSELRNMTKAPIFSETERVALLNELVKRGEVSEPDGAIAYMQVLIYKNTAQNFSPTIAQGVSSVLSEQMPGLISQEAAASVLEPPESGSAGLNINKEMQRSMENDEVSPQDITQMEPEVLQYAISNATDDGRDKLRESALIAVEDEELKAKLVNSEYVSAFAKGKAPSSDGRYSQYQKAVSQAKAAQARNQTSSKLASNAQSSQNQAPQTLQQNQSVSIPKNQKAQPKPQPKNNTSTTQQQNTQPAAQTQPSAQAPAQASITNTSNSANSSSVTITSTASSQSAGSSQNGSSQSGTSWSFPVVTSTKFDPNTVDDVWINIMHSSQDNTQQNSAQNKRGAQIKAIIHDSQNNDNGGSSKSSKPSKPSPQSQKPSKKSSNKYLDDQRKDIFAKFGYRPGFGRRSK